MDHPNHAPEPTAPETEQVKEVKRDVGIYTLLATLADSEGGQLLIDTVKTDLASDVDLIASLYKAPELDLRCAVAKLKADLQLLRVLANAPKNAKLAREELSKLLEPTKD